MKSNLITLNFILIRIGQILKSLFLFFDLLALLKKIFGILELLLNWNTWIYSIISERKKILDICKYIYVVQTLSLMYKVFLHRINSFFQHALIMKNFAWKANYCWLLSVSWPHSRWIKLTWKKWCIINLNHCLTAQLISQLNNIWIINLRIKLIKSVKTVEN